MNLKPSWLGLACLVLFAPPMAIAQVSTFELSGTVMEETGGALPGVTLTLSSEESGSTRTSVTGTSGRYVFATMPPGTYYLEVSLSGYATSRYAGLIYFANTKPILNITLRLRAVQESMTFTGEAPLINSSQSQIGHSLDKRQIEELPLVGRDTIDLVTTAGGVTDVTKHIPGSTVYGSKNQNINGTYARYSSYLLDGFGNTRDQHGVAKVDLGVESIEQLRVITNQFSAEYGQSVGGIVSAVTKTGGNDFHGSAYLFLRPGGLDASDPLTGADTALDRQDVGFTFSGPIVSDTTHFFTSLEYRNQDEDVVVTAPIGDGRYQGLFPVGANHTRFLAKVSHQFNDNHQLVGKVILNRENIIDGVGGFQIFDNRRDNINNDTAFYGTLSSAFDSGTVNQLRVGFVSEQYRSRAEPPPEGVALLYPTQGIIGSTNRFQSADEDQWEVSNILSFTKRSHSFKTGFNFFHIGTNAGLEVYLDGAFRFSPTARYPFDPQDPSSAPFLYQRGFFTPGAPTVLDRSENHIQIFFQDDWQLGPHFTLNLGIRWERESSVPDNNNFGPRLGFNWDATRDGRTLVRGGFGVFTSRVFSAVESFELFQGPTGFWVSALTPDDPLFPEASPLLQDPMPPGNIYLSAPDYSPENRRSPRSQHFTLGMERELVPSISLALDATYIRGYDLLLPLDVNAPSTFDYSTGQVRSGTEADTTRPFGVPGTPIAPGETGLETQPFPFGGYRDLYLLSSEGSSRYWGVKTNLTWRADELTLQGVYTWSRARNNGDDFRPENSLPINPTDLEAEWGPSATDIPSVLVINGVWEAPFDLRIAGLLRARSGRTVDPRVGEDLDGDRKTRERAFANGRLLPRNSFRAGGFASADISIGKIFDLGEGRTLEGRFDVFNLTNRLNPDQVLDSFGRDADNPLPSFLAVVSAEPPRQFQISVQFRF